MFFGVYGFVFGQIQLFGKYSYSNTKSNAVTVVRASTPKAVQPRTARKSIAINATEEKRIKTIVRNPLFAKRF